MKPDQRTLYALLGLIALCTGLSLWAVWSRDVEERHDAARTGSLRVGFSIEAPYAYYDARGQVTGEAVVIFQRMATQAGIQSIDWVRMDFASLLPELQIGRIDAIASGLFITPERERIALFTRPTAAVRPALVVRQGNAALPPQPLRGQLASPALRWATVLGATENDLLRQAGVAEERIAAVPNALRGLRAVAESQVDAFAISTVTARQHVLGQADNGLELRVIADGPIGRPAFAFRQTDTSLRDAFDRELLRFVGSDAHRALVLPFGFTDFELAPVSTHP